ncbi:host cell factor 1 isoform X4 [Ixodes scapularis]
MAAPILKWKRVTNTTGPAPRPRHGHRAVAIKDLMIVFGGGNEGIVDELHVYNTSTNQWFVPPVKGDIPPGCAAYGFVCDGTRLLVFGGMVEYGKYSNELYELQASRWEWKRLKPRPPRGSPGPPCPRLGHSFTLIGNKAFLFGGLANDSDDPKNNIPRYLNDLYTLELRPFSSSMAWDVPQVFGQPPPPRESHTAVAYQTREGRQARLIVYGGMSGCRLGDLWQLDVESMSWSKPSVLGLAPLPRSLHSATLIGQRMFVFGGWVPLVMDENKASTHEKEWKCTNTLASLNLETMTWEPLAMEVFEDAVPRARAGHCSVAINSRLYIWSGRDGYRKAWNNQVCCKDLWYLETEKPPPPTRVQLVRASTATLEVCWGSVPTADAYLLQLQRYDVPPTSAVPPMAAAPPATPVAPAAPVTPVAAPPVAPVPVTPTRPTPVAVSPVVTPRVVTPMAAAQHVLRTPTAAQAIRAPVQTQQHATPQTTTIRVPASSAGSLAAGLRGTVTLVRTRSPGVAGQQQIRVIATTPTGQQVVKTVTGTLPSGVQPVATVAAGAAGGQPMSGMAALAAAAAATQKMTTTTSAATPASPSAGIRVVSPSVLSQQGLKLGTLQGGAGQTVRLAAPGTLLKTGGKQIITVHKAGATPGASSQPQIVTLVKTTQGVTLATMPKVSLIQGKAGMQAQQIQGKGMIPQGATIVKLVTTQAGAGGKPQATLLTSQAGATGQPTLLGLTSAGAGGGSPKVITTILRTLPSNMVTVAKAGMAGGTVSASGTAGGPKQQTIVIAAPKGAQGGAKLLGQAQGLKGAQAGQQILVVTTHPQGKATVVGTAPATSEAGKAKTGTTSVNVLPISAGAQLNSVTSASGVKMIVVSSSGLTGQQAFTILTTAAPTRTQLTSSTSPITITMPASRGTSALTMPAKTLAGSTIQLQGTGTAGTQQIVALPAQGLLPSGAQAITIQTKPGASPSQKVLTIVGTSASAASTPTLARVAGHQGVTVVTTQALSSLPISAATSSGKVMLMTAAGQGSGVGGSTTTVSGGVTYTTIPASALRLVEAAAAESAEAAESRADEAANAAAVLESDLQGMETDADSTTDPAMMQSAQALLDTMVPVKITAESAEVCDDGVHCGENDVCDDGMHCDPQPACTDGIHCGTPEPCTDGVHCGTPEPCTDGVHCGTPEPCTDGIHCGTPEPCMDGIHCGTPEPCTDGVHCGTPEPCTDGIHCGTPEPCMDGIHCGTPEPCTDGVHCGTPEPCTDGLHCGTPEPCTDGIHCGTPEPCTDGIHCGTPEPCTDGIHCGTPEPCTDGIHCGTPEPCSDGIHCGTPEPCTDGIHCGTPEPCTDGIHCGTPEPCTDGIHCGTPEPCTDGIHCGTPEPCTDGIHCGTPEPCTDGIHCGTPEPCTDGIHCGIPKKSDCTDGIHCSTPKRSGMLSRKASHSLAVCVVACSDEGEGTGEGGEEQTTSGDQQGEGEGGDAGGGGGEEAPPPQEEAESQGGGAAGGAGGDEGDDQKPPPSGAGDAADEAAQPEGEDQEQEEEKEEQKDAGDAEAGEKVGEGGKALSLETPGALPPAQMCVDDPPARTAAAQGAKAEAEAEAGQEATPEEAAAAAPVEAATPEEETAVAPEQAAPVEPPPEEPMDTTEPPAADLPAPPVEALNEPTDPLSTLASAAMSTTMPVTTPVVQPEPPPVAPAPKSVALPVLKPAASPAPPQIAAAATNGVAIKTEEGAETKPAIQEAVAKPSPAKRDGMWFDVGIFKETSCLVSHFYLPSEQTERKDDDVDVVSVPDHSMLQKQELLPGTAYKFRVAAINACGRGPWSEVSAFKTCLPGYPGAPSAIKISKGPDGAHLSWEAPQGNPGDVTEYSVYLAVRSATTGDGAGSAKTVTSNPSQLAFVRVYCGPQAACTVPSASLASAHVDMTSKPAIIFRIAARNDKGYGPATQVRWLQDGMTPAGGRGGAGATKRPTSEGKGAAAKKAKNEDS